MSMVKCMKARKVVYIYIYFARRNLVDCIIQIEDMENGSTNMMSIATCAWAPYVLTLLVARCKIRDLIAMPMINTCGNNLFSIES